MKKFKYIKFTAIDDFNFKADYYGTNFKNILIDLEKNKLVSGVINFNDHSDNYTNILIDDKHSNIPAPKSPMFSYINSNMTFHAELLDEHLNVIYRSKPGTYPLLMYWFITDPEILKENTGNCIWLKIMNTDTKEVCHQNASYMSMFNEDDWYLNEDSSSDNKNGGHSDEWWAGYHQGYDDAIVFMDDKLSKLFNLYNI